MPGARSAQQGRGVLLLAALLAGLAGGERRKAARPVPETTPKNGSFVGAPHRLPRSGGHPLAPALSALPLAA